MDHRTSLALLERLRQKKAELGIPSLPNVPQPISSVMPAPMPPADGTTGEAFAGAIRDMATSQLKADAGRDVRNLAMAALGLGAAGRGAVGMLNSFRRDRAKKPRGGPQLLPLPYPEKGANFLAGDNAADKMGIPWYMPAMLMAGTAGAGIGWKGVDSVLQSRRKAETDDELTKARKQFHDALLSQYDAPLQTAGSMSIKPKLASEEPSTMTKVGASLDELWGQVTLLLKQGIDLNNLGGTATGMYGAYAGLTGLMAGSFIYDKVSKRSRRAIIEKAMQRRDRRNFMQRPNEIFAVPEPVHMPMAPPASPASPAMLSTDPEE